MTERTPGFPSPDDQPTTRVPTGWPGAAPGGYPPPHGGQPGYPPAYPPPPGYGPPPAGFGPGPGGHPYGPPQKTGTDGFAIASLVLGILGMVLLSVIFGFVALSRIRRSGRGGRGLAIAGLVLSGLWIVLIVLALVGGALTVQTTPTGSGTASPTATAPTAPSERSGTVAATDVQVGDCLADTEATNMLDSVDVVPCSQAHVGEVFAVFDLAAGPYPGAAEVQQQVEDGCNDRLAAYSPSAVTDPGIGLYAIFPLEQNWNAGDRETACIARSDPPTTGSIKGK